MPEHALYVEMGNLQALRNTCYDNFLLAILGQWPQAEGPTFESSQEDSSGIDQEDSPGAEGTAYSPFAFNDPASCRLEFVRRIRRSPGRRSGRVLRRVSFLRRPFIIVNVCN